VGNKIPEQLEKAKNLVAQSIATQAYKICRAKDP
jgi:hypothetical protein